VIERLRYNLLMPTDQIELPKKIRRKSTQRSFGVSPLETRGGFLPRLGSFPFADLKTAVLGHFCASPPWLREIGAPQSGHSLGQTLPYRSGSFSSSMN
jgi:hypothetical protein